MPTTKPIPPISLANPLASVVPYFLFDEDNQKDYKLTHNQNSLAMAKPRYNNSKDRGSNYLTAIASTHRREEKVSPNAKSIRVKFLLF